MIAWAQFLSAGIVVALLLGHQANADGFTVHPRVVDRPDRERLELSFTSETTHYLCIENWPTPGGKLHFESATTALVVNGEKFPIEDFNTGYCTGFCGERIAPRTTISAYLLYKDFHLPAELRYAVKRLEYNVSAYRCDTVPDYRPRLKRE